MLMMTRQHEAADGSLRTLTERRGRVVRTGPGVLSIMMTMTQMRISIMRIWGIISIMRIMVVAGLSGLGQVGIVGIISIMRIMVVAGLLS